MTQEETKQHDLQIVRFIIDSILKSEYVLTYLDPRNPLHFIVTIEGTGASPAFFIYVRDDKVLNEMNLVAVYQPKLVLTEKKQEEQFIIVDGPKCGLYDYQYLTHTEEHIVYIETLVGTFGDCVEAILRKQIDAIKPDESVLSDYDIQHGVPEKAWRIALTGSKTYYIDDCLTHHAFGKQQVLQILAGNHTPESIAKEHYCKNRDSYVKQVTMRHLVFAAADNYDENDPAIQMYRQLNVMRGNKNVTVLLEREGKTVEVKLNHCFLTKLLENDGPKAKINLCDFPTKNEGHKAYCGIFGYPYNEYQTKISVEDIQAISYRRKIVWQKEVSE